MVNSSNIFHSILFNHWYFSLLFVTVQSVILHKFLGPLAILAGPVHKQWWQEWVFCKNWTMFRALPILSRILWSIRGCTSKYRKVYLLLTPSGGKSRRFLGNCFCWFSSMFYLWQCWIDPRLHGVPLGDVYSRNTHYHCMGYHNT